MEDFLYKITNNFDSRFELFISFQILFYKFTHNGCIFVIVTNKKKKRSCVNGCTICKIQIMFSGFEKTLFDNMFDVGFLVNFNLELGYHLKNCLWFIKKLSVCLWTMNTIIILRTLVVIVIYGFIYLIVSGVSKR